MSRSHFNEVFGARKVLLPVIHPRHGVSGAMTAIEVAVDNGADGVWLINQGIDARALLGLLATVSRVHPELWCGVNLLGWGPSDVLGELANPNDLRGIWSDDCGVDAMDPNVWTAAHNTWVGDTTRHGWNGLYFGGTAFKTQAPIPFDNLGDVAWLAATFVDVVTTSGPGTGMPADPVRVRAMRESLWDHPMALASGVTPENVGDYLPNVDAFLVGTGIESTVGVLDPSRVRDLAQAIHQV